MNCQNEKSQYIVIGNLKCFQSIKSGTFVDTIWCFEEKVLFKWFACMYTKTLFMNSEKGVKRITIQYWVLK